MFTRSDLKYEMEKRNTFDCVRFLTDGPCPECKKAQTEILAMYEEIYSLIIDNPRQPIVNIGEKLGAFYVVYKLAELLGYTHIMHKFNIANCMDLAEKKRIWKDVCKHMDWTYIHGL